MPAVAVRSTAPPSAFLACIPPPARPFVRRTFAQAAEHKAEVSSLLLDVKLRADMVLFTPGVYAHLPAAKRLLDALRQNEQAAADYAREVLRNGGHN